MLKKKDIVEWLFYLKQNQIIVVFGTGIESMDFEGRNIRADFDGVSVMSLYLPSGTNLARLEHKTRVYGFVSRLYKHAKKRSS